MQNFPIFVNSNYRVDRFGCKHIFNNAEISFSTSLEPTGAGTGTHWDSIGVRTKRLCRVPDHLWSGQAATISPRHELAQWVDSCTCKIIREKLKENSCTNRIDMYYTVSDQSDKLEFILRKSKGDNIPASGCLCKKEKGWIIYGIVKHFYTKAGR